MYIYIYVYKYIYIYYSQFKNIYYRVVVEHLDSHTIITNFGYVNRYLCD